MRLYSGIHYFPAAPTPDMVEIEDIAHALSNLCRYGGHVKEFYSVAQHSVLCSLMAPKGWERAALLHDATEAYLVDMPRPIKAMLPEYKTIEANLARCVEAKFGFDPGALEDRVIKEVDNRMLITEAMALLGITGPEEWGFDTPPYEGLAIESWSPALAKQYFLNRYEQLFP